MKNYYELNIPFLPLKPEYTFPIKTEKEQITIIDNTWASAELLEWIDRAECKLFRIILFSLPPFFENQHIHIDGTKGKSLSYTINWAFGSRNMKTIWYSPLSDGYTTANNLDGSFTKWYPSDAREIDSTTSRGPMLVRSDIPHHAKNFDELHRWCVSIRLDPRSESWDLAVSRFKHWLKDEYTQNT